MNWQLGQVIRAKVIEKLNESALIVSFGGNLLRVENKSRLQFEVDSVVALEVIALDPLRFRLARFDSTGHLVRTA